MSNKLLLKKLPQMILFDYGHTLIYEKGFDAISGYEAVLAYAARNDNHHTASEIAAMSDKLFMEIGYNSRNYGIEIHDHMFERFMSEYLEIEYSLSPREFEKIFWEAAAPGVPMPNVREMLAFIDQKGIRSGVISNIAFSGDALSERINRLLPENHFEFTIASSEYIFRKPNKLLFELALKKAHLKPEEVWFCGDHPKFDISGASGAGIYPVWYQSELDCYYLQMDKELKPDCEFLHIHDWKELIAVLQNME